MRKISPGQEETCYRAFLEINFEVIIENETKYRRRIRPFRNSYTIKFKVF
jgi:hypothetical protein